MKNAQKSLTVFIALAIIILSIYPVSAITGSIGNARMILYPEVNGWTTTTIDKTILVKNVNNVSVDITLETNEEGAEFIEIIDSKFTLQADEEKKAKFVVRVKKEGTYEGKINVFFKPIDEEGPGVALSSDIVVVAEKDQNYQDEIEEQYGEDIFDEEENSENLDSITGKATDVKTGFLSGSLIFMAGSMIVLLIALAFLIFINNKKRETKRGGKLNGNKNK